MAGADEVRKMIKDAGGDKPIASAPASAEDLVLIKLRELRDAHEEQLTLQRQIAEDVRWARSWITRSAVYGLLLAIAGAALPFCLR
jgi:hypothetical protein